MKIIIVIGETFLNCSDFTSIFLEVAQSLHCQIVLYQYPQTGIAIFITINPCNLHSLVNLIFINII